MNCWCGHGPWHYHGYAYPPGGTYAPPPPAYYPSAEPAEPYGYGRRRRRRGQGRADADELADYLHELEEEIVRLRRELDELRNSDTEES